MRNMEMFYDKEEAELFEYMLRNSSWKPVTEIVEDVEGNHKVWKVFYIKSV